MVCDTTLVCANCDFAEETLAELNRDVEISNLGDVKEF
jgi:hypothetical protein